jgi:hypothetical protein
MTIIDEDPQYTIGVVSRPSDPAKPGTVELETADLLQLAQRGTIDVERRSEPKLATEPKIVVDLGPSPVKTPRGTAHLATPTRGNTLVIVVYVLATAALGVSIYTRWLA